jgi:putative transposase
MKRKRFTEEQIIGVLKESEAGAKTKELCRKHGISDATLYNWKAKYAGMTVSEARRLRELEHENTRILCDRLGSGSPNKEKTSVSQPSLSLYTDRST